MRSRGCIGNEEVGYDPLCGSAIFVPRHLVKGHCRVGAHIMGWRIWRRAPAVCQSGCLFATHPQARDSDQKKAHVLIISKLSSQGSALVNAIAPLPRSDALRRPCQFGRSLPHHRHRACGHASVAGAIPIGLIRTSSVRSLPSIVGPGIRPARGRCSPACRADPIAPLAGSSTPAPVRPGP